MQELPIGNKEKCPVHTTKTTKIMMAIIVIKANWIYTKQTNQNKITNQNKQMEKKKIWMILMVNDGTNERKNIIINEMINIPKKKNEKK